MRFAGLRTVSWVSVMVEHGHARAQVHGLGHRSPKAIRISLKTASDLAAAGVPTVIRHARDGRAA